MHIVDIVQNTVNCDEGPLDLPNTEIECPECKEFFDASRWAAFEVPCDCCGGHFVLNCPNHHYFDPYRVPNVKEFSTRNVT